MDKKSLLKMLPKTDLFASDIKKKYDFLSRELSVLIARKALDNIRGKILDGIIDDYKYDMLFSAAEYFVNFYKAPSLKRVINATGVIVHTNLGRSPLSEDISKYVFEIATRYSNLEYDVKLGERGSRYDHVEEKLKELTGAEGALVVNNNAAAVMLVLNTFCSGKEGIVSRGELVEIGGSFRVPEVMKLSGAILKEVGCTNRTKIQDYKEAICDNTGLIIKVHPSNFKLIGFTEEVSVDELVALGKERNIIVYNDIGSASLVPLDVTNFKIPSAKDMVNKDVDILSFSGDKMVGGPQAGIIVGKKRYIDVMKKNNLLRAFRIDKLSLVALEGTLLKYFDYKELPDVPIIKKIAMDINDTFENCQRLKHMLANFSSIETTIGKDQSTIGGGSLPEEFIKSFVLNIKAKKVSAFDLEKKLRNWRVPIVIRIKENNIVIDSRTLFEDDYDEIYEFFKDFEGDLR